MCTGRRARARGRRRGRRRSATRSSRASAPRPSPTQVRGRCRDRDRADGARGVRRAQGLRVARDRVTGRAAHGSQAQLGIDAIAKSRPRADRASRSSGGELAAEPGHPLLGTGLAARLADRGRPGALELPGALPRPARAPHRAGRGRRARRGAGARARGAGRAVPIPACAPRCARRSCGRRSRSPTDAEIVRARARAMPSACSAAAPPVIGWAAWMDSAILAQAGIPTVIFGPGGDGRARDAGMGRSGLRGALRRGARRGRGASSAPERGAGTGVPLRAAG